ncbi:Tripartite-type tricarboxylate transporter, receptor component TctC [Enhydrobacter aerosaccus]|uniref:Tripartite-type tricarboxylate transporter, receptor component TctC n=1 Tax=Enhydrobacter aerosaccus TaxID=225324 RepID=A0A1T4MWV8_9HYPH|nr:tripartite tricarboxylate transporter substrate-binding protein [Enhydrobacter aerosaccus]SJZ71453.1 Tripartite-type tricarboxylate transporter, receptor component TctC [Enhydrobacter aerosaccus]
MARLNRRRFVAAAMGLGLAPRYAAAEDYPAKPVRVVVPYPAGGGTDIVARLVMPRVAERWKQTVIIDNKGGASGIVGSEVVARAPADGYTLMVMTSAHTINPYTSRHLPYDTERDFTPITPLVMGALSLVGSVKAGFDTIDKFLAAARAEPGKFQFGSTENTTRMVGELFRLKSGLKIENVAYKGAAPMLQELAGGHIPVGFTSPLTALSHHRAGTIRILAVTADKRLSMLPEVPTMAEAGVSGVDQASAWFSLFGPGHLPPELTQRIHADVAAVLAEPETLARIHDLASEPGGEAPDVFARRITVELAMWREIAKEAGIEPE